MLGLHDINADMLSSKLEESLAVIKQVNQQFKNPVSFLVSFKKRFKNVNNFFV
jgi:hypothetical protein